VNSFISFCILYGIIGIISKDIEKHISFIQLILISSNITNIDISNIVIKQMRDINNGTRPNLIYEYMDATQMTYPNERFSVVFDKGTLDALMPDTKDTTIATIDKYFEV